MRERPDPGESETASQMFAFTADRGDEGVRLDLVLIRYLRGRRSLSRRRLQAIIEGGSVVVNGRRATKTAARVSAGDRIEASLPAVPRREAARPQHLPLDVVFEDEHLLAIDKPPGIVVHPSYKHVEGTLFNALLWHLRETGNRPRLLNRLDKDTSGLVLVSKSREAHGAIIRAMRAGAVRKEYLAVVRGVPKPATGTIAARLGRDPRDTRRVTTFESDGKESVTRYEMMCSGMAERMAVSLVRCELVTGRMHQIRVHMAGRGWPIVGDSLYGAGSGAAPALPSSRVGERRAGGGKEVAPPPAAWRQTPDSDRQAALSGVLSWPRQALHAWRVSLAHPITGAPLVLVAPVPGDLRRLMQSAGLMVPA